MPRVMSDFQLFRDGTESLPICHFIRRPI
jgi:hypothetical protein